MAEGDLKEVISAYRARCVRASKREESWVLVRGADMLMVVDYGWRRMWMEPLGAMRVTDEVVGDL